MIPQRPMFYQGYREQHTGELAEWRAAEENRKKEGTRRRRATGPAETSKQARGRSQSLSTSVESRQIVMCLRDKI